MNLSLNGRGGLGGGRAAPSGRADNNVTSCQGGSTRQTMMDGRRQSNDGTNGQRTEDDGTDARTDGQRSDDDGTDDETDGQREWQDI